MKRLEGKIAAVTGGSQGIGLAVAREFAAQGANLALCSVDDLAPKAAQDLAAEFGVKAFGVKTNVSVPADCDAFAERALSELGGLDILVNNAGVARDNLAVRLSEEQWDLVLDVNLKGAFFMSKAALKHMMRNRSGRIINLSSVVGQMANGGQANYSASKSGLLGLTKSLAREFA
ncbi:MAG: SDR family NAD(P)-dependent oxidoreductase, partial [Elusimicrobia bacterium]|nr:SDR family NAD(P)-dependent oxidoreductase [Elusimicrobiota bacterium]